MENQKSALGLDGNITALIGYIIPLVALILLFMEKDNKFVRFHAFQSIFWNVLAFVAFIGIMIVGFIVGLVLSQVSGTLGTIFGGLMILIYLGVFLAVFGGAIFAAIKAFGGNMFKLPIVGNMAEKYAN
ncbi:MAG: DUF4870 domain-containing protein [Aridibacter sp.]